MTCLVSVAACGGSSGEDEHAAPVANGMVVSGFEDSTLNGMVRAQGSARSSLKYAVSRQPLHGQLLLNQSTGEFTYAPESDFFGNDEFAFRASDGRLESNDAVVLLVIQNVNDPPQIRPLEALSNSAERRDIQFDPGVSDADGDQVDLRVNVVDSAIADARVDTDTGVIIVRPLMQGVTSIEVTASDGQAETMGSFEFEVGEVTKVRQFAIPHPTISAIEIRNDSSLNVDFGLTYSGTPVFESVEEMLAFAEAMPEEFPGEGLERKIWRFVRDSTYHNAPFNAKQWLYNPWVTINSLGWGFCGHVSATFVEIARAAGYEARVWGLDGHVVAEIKIADTWRMYDPDLAVYYKGRSGIVAGVEALAADRALIVDPIDPIFAGSTYDFPYSSELANFFTSIDDNFVGDHLFLDPAPMPRSRFMLPPGAALVFPGRWTEPPTGYNGADPREITQYGQAALRVPRGWSGDIDLPLMLWDIQGSGTVSLEGESYIVGSEDLRDRIRAADAPITTLNVVVSDEGISLIFFINAMKFGVGTEESVALKGVNVWALEEKVIEVSPENARGPVRMRKPLPTTVGY